MSLKLERLYGKDEILSIYLNESPYGGSIYGVEEASQSFFGNPAKDVTLAEAAYLAALPNAPTYYSPYGNHKDKLEERKNVVLYRMFENGFITESEYDAARKEKVEFRAQEEKGIKAPHFVFFIKQYLEEKYGVRFVEEEGLKVITTLDYSLQEKAEEVAKKYALENKKHFNAENAALVGINPSNGEVLVMVGSRDYFDKEIDGNFNVALARRQPGSAFKPFVYAAAFEKGYLPQTVLFDLKTEFSVECNPDGTKKFPSATCYNPENYDNTYRGPVSLREALAQSINIPSIKTLYLAGLNNSLQTAKDVGITTLTDINRYGLTLVLGGGEVSLLEMTSAYGVFGNGGVRIPYNSILRIENKEGKVIEESNPEPIVVIKDDVARKINDVLSDNKARTPAFGAGSPLYFPGRDVAAKTGTTNDYRDAWIIGYTPDFALGAWAGNNDNSPMEIKVAGFIIAPLWNAFMTEVLKDLPDKKFSRVSDTTDKTLPPSLRGFWEGGESYIIDRISGKRATEFTPEETKKEKVVRSVHSILYWIDKNNIYGPRPDQPHNDPQFVSWEYAVRLWKEERAIVDESSSVIPTSPDNIHVPENKPRVVIISPADNALVAQGNIPVFVSATGPYPPTRMDLFVNGSYVASSRNAPFELSFSTNDVFIVKEENEIKVVVFDSVFNKSETVIHVRINAP